MIQYYNIALYHIIRCDSPGLGDEAVAHGAQVAQRDDAGHHGEGRKHLTECLYMHIYIYIERDRDR